MHEYTKDHGHTVTLTWYEAQMAVDCGVRRNMASWQRGDQHKAGYKPKDLFDVSIKAAGAELAVAKLLGLYWDGSVDTFKSQSDIPDHDIEVRLSLTVPPHLIVRPHDPADRRYVLVKSRWVHGEQPRYSILGWKWGYDAKQEKFLTDMNNGRPPAYFLPVKDLHPMSYMEVSNINRAEFRPQRDD